MSNNNYSNIDDLPNEILFIIIKKLNINDVFSLFTNTNARFAQLILDPLYIQNLDTTIMTMNSFYDRTFSVHEQVLSSLCENLLPKIYDQVKKLVIEQHSIERILAFNYSQLYSLTLVNFREGILYQYLKDYSTLRDLLTHQITHLNIDISNEKKFQLSKTSSNIFRLILSLCKRLIKFNFCQLFSYRNSAISLYKLAKLSCTSSTLTELTITVAAFDDCLYLLDGSCDCLSKLIINVKQIRYMLSDIDNTRKLSKLKYFSLTSFNHTREFDEYIIPLLHRMVNLEELTLFLSVMRIDSTFIGGIEFINTGVLFVNKKIDVPSNEDVQRSFIRSKYGQVGSDVHFEPRTPVRGFNYIEVTGVVKFHAYSLPYQFENFLHLNNSFQGGVFVNVRRLTMMDTYSFEYELFKLISNSFPFLQELYIQNKEPQEKKQRPSTSISFPHLSLLNLVEAHVDYAEQFIVDTNSRLPCLLNLCIKYESLTTVTNNFTSDGTRLYCAELKELHIDEPFVRPKHFNEYFTPLLKVSSCKKFIQ